MRKVPFYLLHKKKETKLLLTNFIYKLKGDMPTLTTVLLDNLFSPKTHGTIAGL